MWWIVISASIVSLTKATMSAAGIQGAPRRAVMSEGRRSGGCTRSSAATLRSKAGSSSAAAAAAASLERTAPGEIGVRCLPGAVFRIAEDRVAEFGDHGVHIACSSSAMCVGSTWPRSLSTTASASAAEVMTGDGGGAITRSVKIGPGLAVLVSRS